MDLQPVRSTRLRLPVLGPSELQALLDGDEPADDWVVDSGWPDQVGREHLERWLGLTEVDDGASPWRARAVVHDGVMIGHAGFHGPPVPAEEALADPTFVGVVDPCDAGMVEIGYTIFEPHQGHGFATEAARLLVDTALADDGIGAVMATVLPHNHASLTVIERVGGFRRIGTCRDEDGAEEIVFRRDR